EQHHGDGVEDADGGQLEMLHHEHPAERGRGIEGEAEVEPSRPQGLLARAGELEEIVAEHTHDAEGDRDEYRERRVSHRRLAGRSPVSASAAESPLSTRVTRASARMAARRPSFAARPQYR